MDSSSQTKASSRIKPSTNASPLALSTCTIQILTGSVRSVSKIAYSALTMQAAISVTPFLIISYHGTSHCVYTKHVR